MRKTPNYSPFLFWPEFISKSVKMINKNSGTWTYPVPVYIHDVYQVFNEKDTLWSTCIVQKVCEANL